MICNAAGSGRNQKNIHNGNGSLGGVSDTHHIFPQSRFPELRSTPWNKVECNRDLHILYHFVFGNRAPWEVCRFVGRLIKLLKGNKSRDDVIRYFDQEYWGHFLQTCVYVNGARRRRWKKRLKGIPNYHLMCMVFHKKTPWEIAKQLGAYFSLIGARSEKETISYLANTFWGGFIPNRKPKSGGKFGRRRSRCRKPIRSFSSRTR